MTKTMFFVIGTMLFAGCLEDKSSWAEKGSLDNDPSDTYSHCDGDSDTDADAGSNSDSDTDSDTGSDCDTDVDTDSDTDSDTDVTYSVSCGPTTTTKGVNEAEYDGMNCVGWEIVATDELEIQYFKSVSSCITAWNVTVTEPTAHSIVLDIYPTYVDTDVDCYCCYYHKTTLATVDLSAPLSIEVDGLSQIADVTTQNNGIACLDSIPNDPIGFSCSFSPLNNSCDPSSTATTCEAGYFCEIDSGALSGGVCKRTCTIDDDCLVPVLSCNSSGICEINNPLF